MNQTTINDAAPSGDIMNEIDRRLTLALAGDARYQPRQGIWFAWRPIRLKTGGWRWLCRVRRFKPLGLFWEYFTV